MSEAFYSSMKFKKNFRQGSAATPDEDVTYSEVKTINPTASNTVCHCGSAEHSGQSSVPYRQATVILGLLCALLLAATVVLCVLCSVPNRCLQGWAQLSLKCYYFSNETKSWTDSRSDCEERGADLVIIESVKEQRFINNKTQYYTWIGLSYSAAKGNWLWVNGTPLQKGFQWRGKPGVKNGYDCVLFVPMLNEWDAFDCPTDHHFICETNALLP